MIAISETSQNGKKNNFVASSIFFVLAKFFQDGKKRVILGLSSHQILRIQKKIKNS
jgi:hypothetical protein